MMHNASAVSIRCATCYQSTVRFTLRCLAPVSRLELLKCWCWVLLLACKLALYRQPVVHLLWSTTGSMTKHGAVYINHFVPKRVPVDRVCKWCNRSWWLLLVSAALVIVTISWSKAANIETMMVTMMHQHIVHCMQDSVVYVAVVDVGHIVSD